MSSKLEMVAIIVGIVIALCIAGLYFGGQTVSSTGGYISNSTHDSVLLAWAFRGLNFQTIPPVRYS